jgi:hypothetical protein
VWANSAASGERFPAMSWVEGNRLRGVVLASVGEMSKARVVRLQSETGGTIRDRGHPH